VAVPLDQRLVFSHVIEGLFHKALAGRVTDRLRQRLRDEVQLDLDKKIEVALPIRRWTRCLELCAEELYPELPQEEGIRQMGYVLTGGYFQTFIGSALSAVLKLIGPARALHRMDRSLRSGNNYAEVKVTQLDSTHFQFWCNEVGTLRFNMLGLLSAGAEVAGAKNLRGTITHFDDQGVTIDLRWDP